MNGRTKPLDTVARTSLLVLQGRQRVAAPDGRTLTPVEWLLDMLATGRLWPTPYLPVFEVVHPDVLALLNLTRADGVGGKRFAYRQLAAGLPRDRPPGEVADAVESALRTSFQRAVIRLRNGVLLYQSLQDSIIAPVWPAIWTSWRSSMRLWAPGPQPTGQGRRPRSSLPPR